MSTGNNQSRIGRALTSPRSPIMQPTAQQNLHAAVNLECPDGSVTITETAHATLLQASASAAAPDVVARISSWDADTQIAVIDFDFIYDVNGHIRKRTSGEKFTVVGGIGFPTPTSSDGRARQHRITLDLSGVTYSGSTDQGVMFALPLAHHAGASGNNSSPYLAHGSTKVFRTNDLAGASCLAELASPAGSTYWSTDASIPFVQLGFTNFNNILGYQHLPNFAHYPLCNLKVPFTDGIMGTPELTNHYGRHRRVSTIFTGITWDGTEFRLWPDPADPNAREWHPQPAPRYGEALSMIEFPAVTTPSPTGFGSLYFTASPGEGSIPNPHFKLASGTPPSGDRTVIANYRLIDGYLQQFTITGSTGTNFPAVINSDGDRHTAATVQYIGTDHGIHTILIDSATGKAVLQHAADAPDYDVVTFEDTSGTTHTFRIHQDSHKLVTKA